MRLHSIAGLQCASVLCLEFCFVLFRRLAHGSEAHVELAQRLAGLCRHLGETAEADQLLHEAMVAAYHDSRHIGCSQIAYNQ
jgi:hypothetical protein